MQLGDRIKVLNINCVNDSYGGVPVFLMNVFRHIDHEKIQFDFLTADESSYYPYKQEIKQVGGKIYAFHIDVNTSIGKLRFGKTLYAFLKTHPYDIVHINSATVSFDCISAIVSKSNGTKVIVHSHNTGGRSLWKAPLAYLMKLLLQEHADVLCACSKEAAMNTFTAKKVNKGDVIIIKNGIDLQKFQYNENLRDQVRHDLNLEGYFVIGHVGRFVEQKNHAFLIDIFAEVLKKEPSAILLLIGQGELEPKVRKKVQELRLENNVIFLGVRNDVEDLYQAMDVFLFPSLFEGLPISLIEAQANGLPCVISDTITSEVDLTSLIHRVSLQFSAQQWSDEILSIIADNNNRDFYKQKIKEAGYGIENSVKQISQIYEELMLK